MSSTLFLDLRAVPDKCLRRDPLSSATFRATASPNFLFIRSRSFLIPVALARVAPGDRVGVTGAEFRGDSGRKRFRTTARVKWVFSLSVSGLVDKLHGSGAMMLFEGIIVDRIYIRFWGLPRGMGPPRDPCSVIIRR